jgi:large subunit ribosomal protein L19
MVSLVDTMKLVEKKYLRTDLPNFGVGDSIQMKIKVTEADKVRVHPFEGTVISKSGSGVRATFTVRKISFGEGVERTFPLHSPVIESIQVVSRGKKSRAKLYYLRGQIGKKAKLANAQEAAAAPAPTPAPAE